jgi:hypothetical protein
MSKNGQLLYYNGNIKPNYIEISPHLKQKWLLPITQTKTNDSKDA